MSPKIQVKALCVLRKIVNNTRLLNSSLSWWTKLQCRASCSSFEVGGKRILDPWSYIQWTGINACYSHQLNLSLKNAYGQCYDGTSAMAGWRSGLAKDDKLRAIIHCYGHSLNLAANGMPLNEEVTHEITKLVLVIKRSLWFSPGSAGVQDPLDSKSRSTS